MVLDHGEASVCLQHPGFESDVVATASTAAFADVFQGYQRWSEAVDAGRIEVADRAAWRPPCPRGSGGVHGRRSPGSVPTARQPARRRGNSHAQEGASALGATNTAFGADVIDLNRGHWIQCCTLQPPSGPHPAAAPRPWDAPTLPGARTFVTGAPDLNAGLNDGP